MKKLMTRLAAALCALALCLTPAAALSVEQALELLETHYIDKIPAAAYKAQTLDELFRAVGDPYTYYMDAEESKAFNNIVERETSVVGIGAGTRFTEDGILISTLVKGGAALEAGLQTGDLIVAIEGTSCVPAGDEHRSLITGEAGTFVRITVLHPNGDTEELRLERRALDIRNTRFTLMDGVGYIECDSFGSQTAQYFRDCFAQYGDEADLWVVDVRGNLGGLANTAVKLLGDFTGQGPKLYYRLADSSSFYTVHLSNARTDKPVIVLVDGDSASGSEVLAAGIRAERAGIVLGSRTYGKGTAQILLTASRYPELFSDDSLKVTVYRFYCADSNTTDRIGVIPTLLVDDAYTEDIAFLLNPMSPESSDFLIFVLNETQFCVDPAAAREAGLGDALDELLSALPPDARVLHYTDARGSVAMSPAEAVRLYGDPSLSRGFSDVANSPFADEINTLAVYGMLGGDGAGHFSPTRTLTRAELAAMLAKALNVMSNVPYGFTDVPQGSWYAGEVNAVAALGFLAGVGNACFAPDDALTQEQLITVMGRLVRFLNFRADDYALELTEEQINDPAFASLHSWARVGASVMTNFSGNMLYTELSAIDPLAPVTREQAAATLCRVFKTLGILTY